MKKIGFIFIFLLAVSICFAGGQRGGSVDRPAGMTDSGYPIADGSITLRYWKPMNAGLARFITSLAENTAYQEQVRRTGINIEWTHPAIGMEQEQFNLMIAARDWPDIIAAGNLYRGGEFAALNDGVLIDLRPHLPTLAPSYWQLIVDDEEFYRQVSNYEGGIVGFYAYKPPGDPPAWRILIRQDVLDEVGMGIPRTIDDHERLFQRMLAMGLTPWMPEANGLSRQFIGAFGIVPGFFIDENGRIAWGQVRPEFRQYLELMNRWYDLGYISRDFTSVHITQTRQLFDTRAIGMFIDPVAMNFNRGRSLGFDVASAPYPRQRLGQQLHHENADIWPLQWRGAGMASVSSTSRYQEAAIRWLDYAYTTAGIELYNWGVEGLNWNWIGGQRVYNDLMLNNPTMGTEEASYFYKMHIAPRFSDLDVEVHANLLVNAEALAIRKLWGDDPQVDSRLVLPPFQLTEDEHNLNARIMSQVNTYSDEMVLRFIVGAEPLSNFNNYVATINDMGLQEVLNAQQRAYERHMSRRLER